MRLAADDYVTYNDVVSSDTCSMLSTAYTASGLADFMTKKGGEKDMMGLYEVNVVDTKKNQEVLENLRVIAKDEDKAKMFAVTELGKPLDIENHQFFVRCIGQWESRKPKEVKIVKEG